MRTLGTEETIREVWTSVHKVRTLYYVPTRLNVHQLTCQYEVPIFSSVQVIFSRIQYPGM